MILLLLNNKGFEESKSVYFCLLVFYTIKVNNLQNVFNINDLIRNSKLRNGGMHARIAHILVQRLRERGRDERGWHV